MYRVICFLWIFPKLVSVFSLNCSICKWMNLSKHYPYIHIRNVYIIPKQIMITCRRLKKANFESPLCRWSRVYLNKNTPISYSSLVYSSKRYSHWNKFFVVPGKWFFLFCGIRLCIPGEYKISIVYTSKIFLKIFSFLPQLISTQRYKFFENW